MPCHRKKAQTSDAKHEKKVEAPDDAFGLCQVNDLTAFARLARQRIEFKPAAFGGPLRGFGA